MPVIERGNLRVELIDEGNGPPVVLSHSSVSGNRQWKRLIGILSDRYRVLAPNLYGYGQTTAWTEDGTQTIDAAAEVLLAVCEGLEGPIRLVGHSWGGSLALAAAKTLGARVSHLVLFEPMLVSMLRGQGGGEGWAEASALHADVKQLGGSGQWEALARRFTDYFNGEGAWQTTAADRRQAIAALLLPNYYEWDAAHKATTADSFANVSARTLLMRAADTRLAMSQVVDLLSAAFPQWQVAEVADGGHMAPMTRPDVVNLAIAAFLDSPQLFPSPGPA